MGDQSTDSISVSKSCDLAYEVLKWICEERFAFRKVLWRRTYGTLHLEEDIMSEALQRFKVLKTSAGKCFLYGWADQVVLTKEEAGDLNEIGEKFLKYRPDQNGDSGVVCIDGPTVTDLLFSFERGNTSVSRYYYDNNRG